MTTVWVLSAAVAVVLLGWVAVRGRGRRTGLDSVESFAAARAVTNRWSEDPASTPKPLRDYLSQQAAAREADEA